MRSASAAAPRTSEPVVQSALLASLARRFAALGYESLVLGAIVLLAGFLTVSFVSPGSAANAAFQVPSPAGRVLSAAVVFFAVGAYCMWSWSGGRRTLPMQTWRIELARAGGEPVGTANALVRYLAAWIGPAAALATYAVLAPVGLGAHAAWLVALNYVWAFVDPERQFLHDRIAGTRIVMASTSDLPGFPARAGRSPDVQGRPPR